MLLISNNCIQAWHARFTKQEQNCFARTIMNEDSFFKLFQLRDDNLDFSNAVFSIDSYDDPEVATANQIKDEVKYVTAEIAGVQIWFVHQLRDDLDEDLIAQQEQWMRRISRNPDFAKNALYVFGDQYSTYSAEMSLEILKRHQEDLKTKRLIYVTRFKQTYDEACRSGIPNVVFEKSAQVSDAAKKLKNIGIR